MVAYRIRLRLIIAGVLLPPIDILDAFVGDTLVPVKDLGVPIELGWINFKEGFITQVQLLPIVVDHTGTFHGYCVLARLQVESGYRA